MPKTDTAKLLVEQATTQLQTVSAALTALQKEMQALAAALPEYPVVIKMCDVRRFLAKKSLGPLLELMRRHTSPA